MESLDNSKWDVVIAGTGLHESLLALALSRCDKKILHVDKNQYYGGEAAALSITDASEWAAKINTGHSHVFSNAAVRDHTNPHTPVLGHPRRYSLALAPQLIYAKSSTLSKLVSAKIDSQLEFLAMGNWWLCSSDNDRLFKVPNSREDMFSETLIDARSKRSLIKFLRFAATYEQVEEAWQSHADTPFSTFLETQYGVRGEIQEPLAALAMALAPTSDIQTQFGIRRIARHLRSLGIFGPNFGAVLPKYGGLAEVTQVACRSCAVGGATYVLGEGVVKQSHTAQNEFPMQIELSTGDQVSSKIIVYGEDNIPDRASPTLSLTSVSHSISVVGNTLDELFPSLGEDSPPPAGATVRVRVATDKPPVTIIVHTSDSGECPTGQCICYATVLGSLTSQTTLLDDAVKLLLTRAGALPDRHLLWTLHYEQQCPEDITPADLAVSHEGRQITFPVPSSDLVLEDEVLDRVKAAWMQIMGPDIDEGEFMKFERREGATEAVDDV